MLSDRTRAGLSDIAAAIRHIQAWAAAAGGAEKALADPMVRSAIERQLLIVSEAAIRIDRASRGSAEAVAPSVDWAGVRGMGNALRHRYDTLDPDVILDVIVARLDPLLNAVEAALG